MRELPQKILVIRLSSIGDIILSSPLLRTLRKKVGNNARIDFVVKKEFAELVKFNHHISITHELDTALGFKGLQELKNQLQKENYELVIDLQNNFRSIFLRNLIGLTDVVQVDKLIWKRMQLVYFKRNIFNGIIPVPIRYLKTLNGYEVFDDGKGLEVFVPDEIQFSVSGKIASLKLNQYEKTIALCPGAKHATKKWQKEKFIELGIELSKTYNAKIILFGSKEEEPLCAEIENKINSTFKNSCTSFAGQFSILESVAAIEFCDLVVTNDSALMHIACAKHKKIIAIFGSTVKEFGFIPFQTESVIVERNDVECRPCSHIGKNECPKGHFNCMELITVDDVKSEVKNLLN
ncbi:MAG: glycosyltransferase family 9 protein [Bacteroidetes bacterium]|nr:glycosyltransferase family 9 protein [Bacteroidota bacterium]